jgi:hypothetical protein
LAADYNDLLKELASPKLKSIGCYTLGETIGKVIIYIYIYTVK